jgi:hypothetical protein
MHAFYLFEDLLCSKVPASGRSYALKHELPVLRVSFRTCAQLFRHFVLLAQN